jgi:hypothetical protein
MSNFRMFAALVASTTLLLPMYASSEPAPNTTPSSGPSDAPSPAPVHAEGDPSSADAGTALANFVDSGVHNAFFESVRDEKCTGGRLRSLALEGNPFWSTKKPVPLESGVRLFIKAHSKEPAGPYRTHRCWTLASFVPDAGHKYDISLVAAGSSCAVVVVDEATGVQPTSFVAPPFEKSCLPFL